MCRQLFGCARFFGRPGNPLSNGNAKLLALRNIDYCLTRHFTQENATAVAKLINLALFSTRQQHYCRMHLRDGNGSVDNCLGGLESYLKSGKILQDKLLLGLTDEQKLLEARRKFSFQNSSRGYITVECPTAADGLFCYTKS